MKFVFAAAIVALTGLALPAAAKPCDENASEAMKRPGGYCEIVTSNSSLSTPSSHTAAVDGADKNSDGDWELPADVKVPAI